MIVSPFMAGQQFPAPSTIDTLTTDWLGQAKATLFDSKCNAIFDFGAAARNTVCWAPHGRFLCIAGFGNLAGDMDFWDRFGVSTDVNCCIDGTSMSTIVLHTSRYKLKRMGSTNSSCAVQVRLERLPISDCGRN